MKINFLKNKKILQELWYFLSLLIVIIITIELIFPNLVLIYLNPLFFLVLWLILAIYLLYRN
jgi:hypothetical protein